MAGQFLHLFEPSWLRKMSRRLSILVRDQSSSLKKINRSIVYPLEYAQAMAGPVSFALLGVVIGAFNGFGLIDSLYWSTITMTTARLAPCACFTIRLPFCDL